MSRFKVCRNFTVVQTLVDQNLTVFPEQTASGISVIAVDSKENKVNTKSTQKVSKVQSKFLIYAEKFDPESNMICRKNSTYSKL